MPSKTVFLSAGEASGDRYAYELATRLLTKNPDLALTGIGGKRLQSLTQDTISSADWGAVGILESLKVAPRALRGYRWAKTRLAQGPPGLFLPIDYGYLNIRLAKAAKELGWKVLYFIPPGSWRRTKQGTDLPAVTDQIVTPFPWSADILNQMGATAHFFGHPLKQMVAQAPDPNRRSRAIAVLPGSRMHEIQHNLPVIAQAVQSVSKIDQVQFAVASSVSESDLKQAWTRLSQVPASFSEKTYEVLKSSQAAIVCSGTATLESALCRCPTVVMYRGSKWMEIEFKIRKPKFDYISLPNILLDRPVLPELIQWDATPESVAQHLDPLIQDSPLRRTQLDAFEELDNLLGPTDALDQTVDLALQMLTP